MNKFYRGKEFFRKLYCINYLNNSLLDIYISYTHISYQNYHFKYCASIGPSHLVGSG